MAKQLVRVISAEYVREHQLRIAFSDGTEKTVAFSRWLHGEVFCPLSIARSIFSLPIVLGSHEAPE